ncbi:alpha/beta hydrolase [Pseudomonas sp. MBLB4136]|uniref:alpha/beta hydrolase n=1 Tax=Pseudomonas sp. MBLB4136 TaxID=3451558 RepID=UPI003F752660
MKTAELYSTRELSAWLYEPATLRDTNRLFVCVHGISRNARQQQEAFRATADELGVRLLAPEFSHDRFPGYQRLDNGLGLTRADLAFNRMLMSLGSDLRVLGWTLDMFGYSGGAQFCHRYALCYPARIRSLVLTGAGWYTFPDRAVKYPRGLANWPSVLPGPAAIETMTRIPTLVLVGDRDTLRDASLRKGERIDKQQGRNRLVRAHKWVESWRQLGHVATLELAELQGGEHDFALCAEQTDMLQRVSRFLARPEGN